MEDVDFCPYYYSKFFSWQLKVFHLQGIVCYASHDCPDKTVCKCKVGFGCESLKGTNDDNSDVSSSNDDANGSNSASGFQNDYSLNEEQDKEDDDENIGNNIKQISAGGHRSLNLHSKSNNEKCLGTCNHSKVHNGCKYGFSCKVSNNKS